MSGVKDEIGEKARAAIKRLKSAFSVNNRWIVADQCLAHLEEALGDRDRLLTDSVMWARQTASLVEQINQLRQRVAELEAKSMADEIGEKARDALRGEGFAGDRDEAILEALDDRDRLRQRVEARDHALKLSGENCARRERWISERDDEIGRLRQRVAELEAHLARFGGGPTTSSG